MRSGLPIAPQMRREYPHCSGSQHIARHEWVTTQPDLGIHVTERHLARSSSRALGQTDQTIQRTILLTAKRTLGDRHHSPLGHNPETIRPMTDKQHTPADRYRATTSQNIAPDILAEIAGVEAGGRAGRDNNTIAVTELNIACLKKQRIVAVLGSSVGTDIEMSHAGTREAAAEPHAAVVGAAQSPSDISPAGPTINPATKPGIHLVNTDTARTNGDSVEDRAMTIADPKSRLGLTRTIEGQAVQIQRAVDHIPLFVRIEKARDRSRCLEDTVPRWRTQQCDMAPFQIERRGQPRRTDRQHQRPSLSRHGINRTLQRNGIVGRSVKADAELTGIKPGERDGLDGIAREQGIDGNDRRPGCTPEQIASLRAGSHGRHMCAQPGLRKPEGAAPCCNRIPPLIEALPDHRAIRSHDHRGCALCRPSNLRACIVMSKPIRVLQLAKHFDPDAGGIETVTLNISEMLLQHDIQADVLCTEVKGPYQEHERGYRVIRCKADLAFGNKRLSRQYVTLGKRLERDYDCAIVHVPNPLAVLVALSWRKPVIVLWHADIPQAPIRWATTPIDHLMLRKAAAVIGPTQVHLSQSLRARHIAAAARTAIIPLPFDRSLIPAATGTTPFSDRLRLFRRGRAMSISIGRMVSYKGFDVLTDAARDFGDNLCAVIVGKGPLAETLAEQIKATGVEDRVMIAGALTPEELADAFAQARIGCMPSITAAEMYGMTQVESMAAGLPMVSTDLPRSGVPFVNKNDQTGLIVPPGDARALAAAMLRLVDDQQLWQRLRDGALLSIEQEHDQSVVGARYAELIREVCDEA